MEDVCIAVCDGLKGLPEAITAVWEQDTVQTCVIHLIRNTFRYAPRQHSDELSRDLKPVYTAPTEAAARERFGEFEAIRPRGIRRSGGSGATPGPSSPRSFTGIPGSAPVICSTNAIESLNARYRRAVRARGHFPNDAAALKCLYLVTRPLDPTGQGPGTMGHEVEAGSERIRGRISKAESTNHTRQARPTVN